MIRPSGSVVKRSEPATVAHELSGCIFSNLNTAPGSVMPASPASTLVSTALPSLTSTPPEITVKCAAPDDCSDELSPYVNVAVLSYWPVSDASVRSSMMNDVKSPLFGPDALKYFMMMAFCAGVTPFWSRSWESPSSPWPFRILPMLSALEPSPVGTLPKPMYTTRFSHTPMVGSAANRTLLANSSCVMPSAADLSTSANRSVRGYAAYCSVCASPASVVATMGMYTTTPLDAMAWPPCNSSVSRRLRCCGEGSEPPAA